jgi:hypothetical protein
MPKPQIKASGLYLGGLVINRPHSRRNNSALLYQRFNRLLW